jgi:signal peptidase II
MPALAWVGLTVVSVACVDQASKAVLVNRLGLNRSVRIGRGVRLRHVANTGWWAHGVRSSTALVLLWSVAVTSSLLVLELDGSFGEGAALAGVAVALGGATGNLVDRLARGRIVDFIEIGFWPVFNVADAGIVAGIGLALTAPLL